MQLKILLLLVVTLIFSAFRPKEEGGFDDGISPQEDIQYTGDYPDFFEAKPLKVIALPGDNKLLVISEEPAKIIEYDLVSQALNELTVLPEKPTGAVLSRDSGKLFVTAGAQDGEVIEVDIEREKVIRRFSTSGHTPESPILTSDEQFLFVCNRFNNEVVKIGLKKGRVVKHFPVVREPRTLVISKEGRSLFAGNFLPAGPSDAERVNSSVSVIDLHQETVRHIELPNGSYAIRSMMLSPEGRFLYVTHVLGRHQVATTQIERGWINTNALSIIDAVKKELITTVLLDDHNLGFSNPSAIACSPDGRSLCIASFGGNELSLINRDRLHEKIENSGSSAGLQKSETNDFSTDLLFMSSIQRQRIPLPGYGPNSMVFSGNALYISEYFSGTLAVADLTKSPVNVHHQMVLGEKESEHNMVRFGEMLFNNADLCYQHWQSCATCHPDGRMDGLNWDLLNDGIGNPKNTKSMLHAHKTPPSMSLGVRATAEDAVRAGIRYIQFAAVKEQQARAIDVYLQSLTPLPSPFLVNDEPGKRARRGKVIFEREGCVDCHPAPIYTDLKKYNVNSGKNMEKENAFDNPALVEVWRTAPYLHDGSAKTMDELIAVHNPHGTKTITPDERQDLIEFVLSL